MSIKALVSDFDGTLVGNDHLLAADLVEQIKAFMAKGQAFAIATGRAYEGVIQAAAQDLGLRGLVIVRGGAEIVNVSNNQVVWGKYIQPELVKKVVSEIEKIPGVFFAVEHGQYIFTTNARPHAEFGVGAEFKDLVDLPDQAVPKIVLPPITTSDEIDPILKHLSQLFPSLHMVKTISKRGFGIDINDGGAGKHSALLEFAKLSNLLPSEIVGVGDGFNDYSLLSACGLKIAMGNAPDSLKEIADLVVPAQTENGFFEALKIAEKN